MKTSQRPGAPVCPFTIGRRGFLAAAGASALAMKTGIFDVAASLFAGQIASAGKPRVRAVFVRPQTDRYWMGWPGAGYDVKAAQGEYTKTLEDAAKEMGLQLEVSPAPLNDPDRVDGLMQQLEKSPPDGLVVTVMEFRSWPQVNYIVKNRGDIPTIVFTPLGTSFTRNLQATRHAPKTFVAATPDAAWLASGMRMLKTVCEMKRSRICMVVGNETKDRVLSPVGTTLRYVPLERWVDEYRKTGDGDEMQTVAEYYAREAKKIIEPRTEDVLAAVKNYVVARRIMAAEDCRGISVDCFRLVNDRRIPCGPCLAFSRLLDEGRVGACEADENAAISMLLTGLMFQRPGFMQDAAPNTVQGTLIGSHCTCATKLAGYDQPHEPFLLRSHAESNTGVAPQVLWQLGQEITILKFLSPGSMLLGTGHVVSNIESSLGGCRTAVEVKVDGVADPRDVKGHHQLFVYGKLDGPLRAYCQLAGIDVVELSV